MGGEWHEIIYATVKLRMETKWSNWFFRGMWILRMVLVGYGSNDERLRKWERVDWTVYQSDFKLLHQGLLLHQFSEQ